MRSTDDPSSVGAADDSPLVFEGDSHSVEMDDPPSVGAEDDSPLVEGDSHHPPPS